MSLSRSERRGVMRALLKVGGARGNPELARLVIAYARWLQGFPDHRRRRFIRFVGLAFVGPHIWLASWTLLAFQVLLLVSAPSLLLAGALAALAIAIYSANGYFMNRAAVRATSENLAVLRAADDKDA
jgi:hypothetical protein